MSRPFAPLESVRPRVLALVVVAGVALGTPMHAQQIVEPGREATGRLEVGDREDDNGARYDVYRIRGGTPGILSITLESDDFDTFLEVGMVVGGEFTRMLENDDFVGLRSSTDSRIYVEGNNDWTWEVRASSYYPNVAGSYRLRVEALPGGDPDPQSTSYGADIEGELDESDGFGFQSFQDWYRFRGRAGDRLQVVLEAEFDAYLILRPVGGARLAEDDNGFGDTDAYLETALPDDGEYEVVVRSGAPGIGTYRLRLGTELGVAPPVRPDEGPVVQASGAEEALPLEAWVTGTLDAGDALDASGRIFDGFYAPAGVAGVFAVTVESSVFDPALEAGPSAQGRYSTVLAADDSPGLTYPTDARLYLGLQLGQTFELRVLSAAGDAVGPYRIRIDPVEVGEGEPQEVGMGTELVGELGEGDAFVFGTFLDRYHLQGQAGQVVEVAVDGEFDPFLALGRVGSGGVAEDDNSLDGVGAFIAVVLPEDGLYEIQVSAASSGTGAYRLRVGQDLRPAPAVDPAAAGPVPFTDAERQGLTRDGEWYRNELVGFEFPAPSATIELLPGPGADPGSPDLQTWYLSEEDGSRQLMVIAHRTGEGPPAGRAVPFVEGLLGNLPFQVRERRPEWASSGSADFVLEAPNGALAALHCQLGGGGAGPGLVVCLLGTTADGSSLRETLDGLRVR